MRPARTLAALLLMGFVHASQAATPAPTPTASPSLANAQRFVTTDGEFLYRAICQGCHMSKGEGAKAAAQFPALAANPRLASRHYAALMVVRGRGGMPPLGTDLNDEQIAAVVNYLRSHFNNRYSDVITAAEVKALRP